AGSVANLDVVVVGSRIGRGEARLDLLALSGARRVDIDREHRLAVLGTTAAPPNPLALCAHDVLRGRVEPKLHVHRTAGSRSGRDESQVRDPRPLRRWLGHVDEGRASGQTDRQHDGGPQPPASLDRTNHDLVLLLLDCRYWDGGPARPVNGFTWRGA